MADTAGKASEASAKAEKALEDQLTGVVGSEAFAKLLAETMGTTMGLVRLSNDAFEGVLRAMRLPTQSELTRISTQIVRLEDKLEDVLVAVERLEQRIGALESSPRRARGNGKAGK
jgi:hypothetical protein